MVGLKILFDSLEAPIACTVEILRTHNYYYTEHVMFSMDPTRPCEKGRLRILLTGFEPFESFPVNPTEEVIRKIQRGHPGFECFDLDLHVLPVTHKASLIIDRLLPREYDFVVHLGLHGKALDFAIERVAINMDDFRIPDNSGVQTRDRPINSDGPAAYFSTLPVRRIEEGLLTGGVPCHVSYSAGTYLCNHLLYTTCDFVRSHSLETCAGFIHVPASERMSIDMVLRGVQIILDSLVVVDP